MKISILSLLGLKAVQFAWAHSNDASPCKCLPTESCWPSKSDWDALNTTVRGRLIATVPLASVCHDPFFNNATCSLLQSQWQLPLVHEADASSVMAPFFANQSCDPFTAEDDPCRYGNYVRYAVNVSNSNDIVATLAFAKKNNIRFIIRNTGHDYLGRSTGAGAISIWTHHLKNIELLDWNDPQYRYVGKAAKIGAGVQGIDIFDALQDQGFVAVTGECPTVGIAGGYTQGGGHSPLSTMFGLGADQVLEWEVVTVDGRILTASRSKHTDLYWALSGGGPGNYAVVLSMTIKLHPDSQVGGGNLTFSAEGISNASFFAAIDAFHKELPAIIDARTMLVYEFTASVGTPPTLTDLENNPLQLEKEAPWLDANEASPQFFKLNSITAYNQTAEDVRSMLAPYITVLDSMNITYTAYFDTSTTYHDHYAEYFGPLPVGPLGVGIAQYASRLIPRSTFQSSNATALFSNTVRSIVEQDVLFMGISLDVEGGATPGDNAVLPAWRNALVHAVLTTTWSFDPADWRLMLENQRLMTNEIMPAIEAITPGSGSYMNEGDFLQPDFENVFYGVNYNKLLAIKRAYDPDGILYVTKGVGSEKWMVAENGRMCAS